jgi:hemolysin III
MLLAIPATYLLWRRGRGDLLRSVSLLIFGLGLICCYGGSWLYHSVPEPLAPTFAILDHVGIHLLIAATVTPIGVIVLRGWWRLTMVGGIWLLALAGIAARIAFKPTMSELTAFYLFLGWVGCAAYFELARRLTHAQIRWVWLGGLFYSAGAVINSLHWFDFDPGVFGFHEVFHLFVMAGSACHYWFMLTVVAPYRHAPRPATPAASPVPAVPAKAERPGPKGLSAEPG